METLSPTLAAMIAILAILFIASGAYFVARRLSLPYTAFLAFVGLLLAPLSTSVPGLGVLHHLTLSPDLLFFVFLPTLVFESAYNMRIRQLTQNAFPITLLAVLSLLLSAFAIAGALYGLFALVGYPMPFMATLIFGSLISATDPVAVLALFKEYGAPRKLALIFEGESLFNDATGYALFVIVLGIATGGFAGIPTILTGLGVFAEMMLGGMLAGLVMGVLFSKLVEQVRSNEFISITLMLILAHSTFILTELASRATLPGGFPIHLSSIIATAVAAIVLGNYGRYKVSPRAEEFVEKFWGMLAFLANSLIFMMIGFLFGDLPSSTSHFVVPIALGILVVAAGRAVSVYPVVHLVNLRTRGAVQIPRVWAHILAWGSLRGALAVTMVLLVPADLTFAAWRYPYSPRDFLLALTVGCIFTTLFIKAPTIGPLMKRLRADKLTDLETLEYEEARALIHGQVLLKLAYLRDKKYIEDTTYESLHRVHENAFKEACARCAALTEGPRAPLAERVVRLYAIGVEKQHSRDLFLHGEITESVMKHVSSKLALQSELAEHGPLDGAVQAEDHDDVLEQLAALVRRSLGRPTAGSSLAERYMYYRAQSIIAHYVLHDLEDLAPFLAGNEIFTHEALAHTRARYTHYATRAHEKMLALVDAAHGTEIAALRETLARHGLTKTEELFLEDLHAKEIITPKVYLLLRDEFERSSGAEHMREL